MAISDPKTHRMRTEGTNHCKLDHQQMLVRSAENNEKSYILRARDIEKWCYWGILQIRIWYMALNRAERERGGYNNRYIRKECKSQWELGWPYSTFKWWYLDLKTHRMETLINQKITNNKIDHKIDERPTMRRRKNNGKCNTGSSRHMNGGRR